jgi:hypothetical protein
MKVQYGHGYLTTLRIDAGFFNGLVLVADRLGMEGWYGMMRISADY